MDRTDWMDLLGLADGEVPRLLVLEPTWWRRRTAESRLRRFDAVRELGMPDLWLGWSGGVPIAFGAPAGAYVWAVGYPAAAPNAGRRALYCRGTVRPDPYRTGAQGLACSMGQGASGGPWLLAGTGAVYAVTSFTYRGMAGTVWAPRLGATAEALYAGVQAR